MLTRALNASAKWVTFGKKNSKECVTTHPLNRLALKMDGARTTDQCWTVAAKSEYKLAEMML